MDEPSFSLFYWIAYLVPVALLALAIRATRKDDKKD